MGSAALKPSSAVGQLLRSRRKEMGLTLRQVSDRMSRMGDRIPTSTLTRIEQGKLDPGTRRLHLLLRLYDVPPHLVADLIELEELSVEAPLGEDLETLYREGIEHWKAGDVARGLAYLFAVRQYVPEDDAGRLLRQQATVSFAIAARNLGKFRLAKQLVDDLLCEPPAPELLPNLLVLASSLWRGLGSREVALALVRQAWTHVDDGDPQQSAWVLHQEAKLLLETGRHDQAEDILDRATARYRELGDTYGEVLARTLRVNLLDRRGERDRALAGAREVIGLAERYGHQLLRIGGLLELGRLLVDAGSAEDGLESLREALGQAVLRGDRKAEFLAHYYLWKSHGRLGDRDRERFEFEAARYFVRFIDEDSAEADEIRRLTADRGST